jgi:hypothetical protein
MSILQNVAKPQPQAPMIIIVGFPGAGKSTLAGLFPDPIFIQAEHSATVFETWPAERQPSFFPQLPTAKTPKPRTSEVLREQLLALYKEAHDYKTVVIDTVTSLNNLFEKEVVVFDRKADEIESIGEAAGGFQKGYDVVAGMHSEVITICSHLQKKGIAIVFLSHSGIVRLKNRPDTESEYKAFTLDMHEKSRRLYVANSDAVVYLKQEEFIIGAETNKKGQTVKTGRIQQMGERILITASDGTVGYIDAKNRYGMPHEIECPHMENPLLQHIAFFNNNTAQKEVTK